MIAPILNKKLLFPGLLLLAGATIAQTNDCQTLLRREGFELAYPRLSADQDRILYQSNESGKWEIRIYTPGTQSDSIVIRDEFNNNFPDWSPDNRFVAWVSDRDGNEEVYLLDLLTGDERNLSGHEARDIHPYFSPDGKFILFNSTRGNGSLDIFRYEISTGKILRLTDTPDDETCARYAPDMHSIVYLRNGLSGDDVFVLHLSNFLTDNLTNTPYLVDGWPVFSADGDWIYFSSLVDGSYSIYRIKPDGSKRTQITFAHPGEEHARVSLRGNDAMVYNRRNGTTIEIISCKITG